MSAEGHRTPDIVPRRKPHSGRLSAFCGRGGRYNSLARGSLSQARGATGRRSPPTMASGSSSPWHIGVPVVARVYDHE